MKRILIFLGLIFLAFHSLGQNNISNQLMSDDGNYVCAQIDSLFIIRSTNSDWRKEIKVSRLRNVCFTKNNDYIIYVSSDSLYKLMLGTNDVTVISKNIQQVVMSSGGANRWLSFRVKEKNNDLSVIDLESWQEKIFENIQDFLFSPNDSILLLKTLDCVNDSCITQLKWVDLVHNKTTTIWSGNVIDIRNIIFDQKGKHLTFMVKIKISNKISNSIWYYESNMEVAKKAADDYSLGIDKGLLIADERISFTPQGSKVLFFLKEIEQPKPKPGMPKVDVYSYIDPVIQSQQLIRLENNKKHLKTYAAVVSLKDAKIIRLEYENQILLGDGEGVFNKVFTINPQVNDDYALVIAFDGNIYLDNYTHLGYVMTEYKWNKATLSTIYLVSLKDGMRKQLRSKFNSSTSDNIPFFRFSPGGKYVIYWDPGKQSWLTYDLFSGKTCNLTEYTNTRWASESTDLPQSYYRKATPKVFWMANDEQVLLQDKFSDVWQFDPKGKHKGINITSGYAQRQNLQFRLTNIKSNVLKNGGKIILAADNHKTLETGFYSAVVNDPSNPVGAYKDVKPLKLVMGHYNFPFGMQYNFSSNRNTNEKYFFARESVEESPALYYTSDFKTITCFKIAEKVLGYNKEIIKWKMYDNKIGYGILYKPIGFNTKKKFPIIFNFYEAIGALNTFEHPSYLNYDTSRNAPIGAYIDLDWFLSHGYLICIVNVDYQTIGDPGKTVYNSVVSAAQYLSNLPFVNSKKMGIIGHSFGGYETNYLITHTSLFAAAFSGEGATDLISNYFSIEDDERGYNRMGSEGTQYRIGVTPWERPDLYLKNSPIYYAQRITTPLLMMDNQNDKRVSFNQGIELFKALRRLGKRCWLLQYDNGEHILSINDTIERKDLGVRMIQFFGHYLKDEPAPVWMTRGIPASLKGIETGYEYDTTMKTPGQGLLMDEVLSPAQKELLKHRTVVNNEGRIVDISPIKSKSITKKNVNHE